MKQNYAMSNLRFYIVILVVLYHAVLAYNSYFYFTDIYMLAGVIPINNLVNPILDTSKSELVDLINGFQDVWFMSTIFFISGMFVWRSLKSKGVKTFLKTRLMRLGIPFVVGVTVLMPIAYYPANLQYASIKGVEAVSFLEFWKSLANIGFLTGPFWFIFVLLAFNIITAVLYLLLSKLKLKEGSKVPVVMRSSILMVALLIIVSLVTFLPMVRAFGYDTWLGKGIINFQTSRIIHYYVYFLAGTWIGAIGIENTVFNKKKAFGLGWIGWMLAGTVMFFIMIGNPAIVVGTFSVLSATYTVGLTGLFMTYFNRKGLLWRAVPYSYSIYIVHYSVSSFVQLRLLDMEASGLTKGLLAFAITALISLVLGVVYRLFSKVITSMLSNRMKLQAE